MWGEACLGTAREATDAGPSACVPSGGQSPCLQGEPALQEGLLGIRERGLGVYVTVRLFLWVFLQILQRRPPIVKYFI